MTWRAARGALLLTVAGIGGLMAGIPQGTQRLADEWCSQLGEWGIPPQIIERLRPALQVWGFILIFIGWVIIGLLVGIVVIWVT